MKSFRDYVRIRCRVQLFVNTFATARDGLNEIMRMYLYEYMQCCHEGFLVIDGIPLNTIFNDLGSHCCEAKCLLNVEYYPGAKFHVIHIVIVYSHAYRGLTT